MSRMEKQLDRDATDDGSDTERADNEAWRAVLRGERELTWGLWSGTVEQSRVLTPEGRTVVLRAVESLAGFLGETWLHRFREKGAPLLSWLWWPMNDAPHVYVRLLDLGLRLELLAKSQGLGAIRKAAGTTSDTFFHLSRPGFHGRL